MLAIPEPVVLAVPELVVLAVPEPVEGPHLKWPSEKCKLHMLLIRS